MDEVRNAVPALVQAGTDLFKSQETKDSERKAKFDEWKRMKELSPDLGAAFDPRTQEDIDKGMLEAAKKAAEDRGKDRDAAYDPHEDDDDEPEGKLKRRRLILNTSGN